MRWRWSSFEALGVADLHDAVALREAVFVVEQDCPYQDVDGRDPQALHLLGRVDGELAAYLRVFAPGVVYAEACLGRVVTSSAHRGQGLGKALMAEALAGMEQRFGAVPVRISAQTYLRAFYEGFGFVVVGPGYLEDGIPHLPMVRAAELRADLAGPP
jgi:ElaA protein